MNDSIFINTETLEQTYLPRLLPYREEQHKYLAECIKPLFNRRSGTNLLVIGPPGIGKTVCVRFVLRKLMEETENIMPIYINCWKRDTSPKIINEIARLMDIRTVEKLSSDELFDRIILRFNKYSGVVFAFDEIDKVKDFDFLYRILEDVPHKTIFLITNLSEWMAKMDRRLVSRLLLDRTEFKPYNFEETRGILHERRKYAFTPNIWDYDAFESVIKKTFASKDIRVGLFLMKNAGENAESRSSEKIEVKDVKKALKKLEDLPKDIGSFI
ncbi:MAG: AAA family ATPase [Candidatus Aenigmarchaeota archaeon]|nr:AAA family ATPase [Candidatus Aenigmarchaeota archaeon]